MVYFVRARHAKVFVRNPKWTKRWLHIHQLGTHALFATLCCELTVRLVLRNGCLETIPMLLYALCCSTVQCCFTKEEEKKNAKQCWSRWHVCTSRSVLQSCISSHYAFLRGPINTTTVPFIPESLCVCTVCLLTLALCSFVGCASQLRDATARWIGFIPIKIHFLPRYRLCIAAQLWRDVKMCVGVCHVY